MAATEATFSRAEVAARRGGGGGAPVWVIYRDGVYDVTNFVAEHPGGDVILEEAGADCTRAFDDVGHSGDAKDLMRKMRVGVLVEEERKYDASGKKRKAAPAQSERDGRSCLSRATCGLLG